MAIGSINEFKSSFKRDLARPNRFDVSIPVPIVLVPYLNTAKSLKFRCEAAELPSRTFSVAEQRFGSNPSESYPYLSTFNDMPMTFIVSDDMTEKLFFDAWMEYINPASSYDLRYKIEYTSTIVVNQYDVAGDLTYSVNLVDAFPVSVNQLDLDWSADGHHKLVVTFAYSRWHNNSLQALGSSLVQSGISALLNGINPIQVGPLSGQIPAGITNVLQTAITTTIPNQFNTLLSFVEDYVDPSYLAPGPLYVKPNPVPAEPTFPPAP